MRSLVGWWSTVACIGGIARCTTESTAATAADRMQGTGLNTILQSVHHVTPCEHAADTDLLARKCGAASTLTPLFLLEVC